jgi:uncharacterized protein (TIGR04255 family)
MLTPIVYSKAPITEALLDIRVELPPSFEFSKLGNLYKAVNSDYPRFENTLAIENNLLTGQSITHQTTTTFTGFRFWHKHQKQVIQAQLDGFTFSRLTPYEGWEAFSKEAKRLWEIYCEVTEPQHITRIALRYINRFDFPLPMQDFSDYLRTTPNVPSDLTDGISDYLMQLRIPEPELPDHGSSGWLSLTEAILPSEGDPSTVSVILDIELSYETDLNRKTKDCWELFEKMHNRKNEVFEACITDKTRELIR